MKRPWTVVTEVALMAQLETWHKNARRELFAVQDLFRQEGPEAFSLYPEAFAGSDDWDALEESCRLEFFVQMELRYLRIELEIRPGRTIIFRRVRPG
jgi:hypothetical protein